MAKTSTSFVKGHKGLKTKGTLHKKTKLLQKMGLTSWQSFGEWINTQGIERYKAEMEGLSGKEYIIAMSLILEYYKPKLTRLHQNFETALQIESITFE